jgi:stress response protein YsnF
MARKNKANVAAQGEQSTDVLESIPVLEEELNLHTRKVPKGGVRVEIRTETLEEVAGVTMHEDVVDIKRVPVELPVEKPPPVRTEGDVLIVPVLEEVVVVERRLMLKEELHIRRERTSKEVDIPVTRRSQRVLVERTPAKK